MKRLAQAAWFVAAALVCGAVDLAQVAWVSGGVGVVRLGAMTLFLYALAGIAGALVAVPLLRRFVPSLAAPGSLVALAFASFGLLLGAGIVNVAYLPSIASPLSLAANALLAGVAIAAWRVLARIGVVARAEASLGAAVAVALLASAVGMVQSRPWGNGAAAIGATATAPSAMPDVFVIVIDSLRVDRTSLGGRSDGLMPHLEELARRSLTFTHAYAQSSWTKPSVGSLFTSLFPSSHGAMLRTGRLSAQPATLPEAFARAGYATAVFSSNPWISPAFGFERGVGSFVESEHESFTRLVTLHRVLKLADKALPGSPVRTVLQQVERAFGVSQPHRSNCLRDESVVEEFAQWLGEPGHGPAFVYFHLMSPHIPYDPPGVAHEDFADAEQVLLQRVTDPLPEPRRARLMQLYDGAVAHGDAMLGRILAAIDARRSSNESVIVVTADHGEEFHEHGAWGHGNSLYDEVVHVPLLVHVPGLEARRIDDPVMLVDVLPTVTAVAGSASSGSVAGAPATAPAAGVDGADVRSIDAQRPAFCELTREGGYESFALIGRREKYIETTPSLGAALQRELYDLVDDAAERHSQWSEARTDLATALAKLRARAQTHRFGGDEVEIDEDARERLKALGYLN
ncbi:MAG: sulfatase [Deltaproteobacteria bacterium]|nr:sulfatase [Deltaproteobacteria bacterium]